MSAEKTRLIVDADVLPEVFLKVMEAKRLLAQGRVRNASEAARAAGVSRSAFYKYKESVCLFEESGRDRVVTWSLALRDEPGVLSAVLARLSRSGANVLTINQSIPVDGMAPVTISFRIASLHMGEEQLRKKLCAIGGVVDCRSLSAR